MCSFCNPFQPPPFQAPPFVSMCSEHPPYLSTSLSGSVRASPVTPRVIYRLSSLFSSENPYDALLLDQFGVLHDGRKAYPGALEAVQELWRLGKKLIMLSNTSRRAEDALKKLQSYGFSKSWFAGAVTSGELAHSLLAGSHNEFRGKKVVHFNWVGRGGVVITEFGLKCVGRDVQTADVLLAHGTEGLSVAGGNGSQVEACQWEELLGVVRAAARKTGSVDFVCANPDVVTVDGDRLRYMPGKLAQEFEDAGGERVVRLGKPGQIAYDAAVGLLARLGVVDRKRILAVGDSLLHDILGAAEAGIDCLFVAGGIAAQQFGLNAIISPNEWSFDCKLLQDLVQKEAPKLAGRMPTSVIPYFRW